MQVTFMPKRVRCAPSEASAVSGTPASAQQSSVSSDAKFCIAQPAVQQNSAVHAVVSYSQVTAPTSSASIPE